MEVEDFQAPVKPIVICTSPRSGSQWLSECIYLGGLGHASEWLANGLLNSIQPEIRFPLVIQSWHSSRALRIVNLCDKKVVWLRRIDIDAQAISLFRAQVGGAYNSNNNERLVQNSDYNFNRILELRNTMQEWNCKWTMIFRSLGIKPIKVSYERLASNGLEMVRLIDRLGGKIDPSGPSPHLKIQRDDLSRRWLDRFRRERREGKRITIIDFGASNGS